MSESINKIAEGHLPVYTVAAGASSSIILEYLELFNSFLGTLAVIVTIFGGYWMYRKNKLEAVKIMLENEQIRLDNHERRIQLDSKEIEQSLEKISVILIEKLLTLPSKK